MTNYLNIYTVHLVPPEPLASEAGFHKGQKGVVVYIEELVVALVV